MAYFEIKKATDGQYYFNFVHYQVIATSETYTTKQNCKNGIETIKTHAKEAPIVDDTLGK